MYNIYKISVPGGVLDWKWWFDQLKKFITPLNNADEVNLADDAFIRSHFSQGTFVYSDGDRFGDSDGPGVLVLDDNNIENYANAKTINLGAVIEAVRFSEYCISYSLTVGKAGDSVPFYSFVSVDGDIKKDTYAIPRYNIDFLANSSSNLVHDRMTGGTTFVQLPEGRHEVSIGIYSDEEIEIESCEVTIAEIR